MRFLIDAVITLLLVAVVLVVVGLIVTRDGLSARAQPSRLEASIARSLRNLATPANAKEQKNPYADKPGSWRLAAEHFQDHCAICHGPDGRGRSPIGQSLFPKAPDMTQSATEQLSDGEIFHVIQNGVRYTGMPAWAAEHSPDETWQLVSFIRHIPRLTPEELEEITRTVREEGVEHEHKAETRPHTHKQPN